MNPTKTTGRILGLLFLLTTIAGGIGTTIRGLSGSDVDTSAFLVSVLENTNKMNLAISLDMLSSLIAVLIALYIFPFINAFNQRLAVGYFGIASINFVILTVSNVIHVALLSVSTDFAALENSVDYPYFIALGKMLYSSYYWVHFFMLLMYSIGGSLLYFYLLKARLIPSWLAIWGLLASVIVFAGGALQLAGLSVSMLLFVQNGIFLLTFIGWLLIVGFRPKAYQE